MADGAKSLLLKGDYLALLDYFLGELPNFIEADTGADELLPKVIEWLELQGFDEMDAAHFATLNRLNQSDRLHGETAYYATMLVSAFIELVRKSSGQDARHWPCWLCERRWKAYQSQAQALHRIRVAIEQFHAEYERLQSLTPEVLQRCQLVKSMAYKLSQLTLYSQVKTAIRADLIELFQRLEYDWENQFLQRFLKQHRKLLDLSDIEFLSQFAAGDLVGLLKVGLSYFANSINHWSTAVKYEKSEVTFFP